MAYFKIKSNRTRSLTDYEKRKDDILSDKLILQVSLMQSYRLDGKVKKRERYLLSFKMDGGKSGMSLKKFYDQWNNPKLHWWRGILTKFREYDLTPEQVEILLVKLESKIIELEKTFDARLEEYRQERKKAVRRIDLVDAYISNTRIPVN